MKQKFKIYDIIYYRHEYRDKKPNLKYRIYYIEDTRLTTYYYITSNEGNNFAYTEHSIYDTFLIDEAQTEILYVTDMYK